jgi:sigma-54 dependent transcriptional regulator, acetoin dehydrogenase operon transcriptional activator AcoR
MHDEIPPSLRPVIQQSWKRSRAAGVDSQPGKLRLRKISRYELAARLELNRNLLAAAKPRLDTYAAQVREVRHVLCLLDSDGIVLLSSGDEELRKICGLQPGYDCSERQIGTNGAGTALAIGQPLAVMGAEHYRVDFRGFTSLAAPVMGPFGRVIGVIALNTFIADAVLDRLTQMVQLAHESGEEITSLGGQRRARARGAKRGR